MPTIAEEDAKRPNRERDCLVGERRRIVNRIKSTLVRLGIRNRDRYRLRDLVLYREDVCKIAVVSGESSKPRRQMLQTRGVGSGGQAGARLPRHRRFFVPLL